MAAAAAALLGPAPSVAARSSATAARSAGELSRVLDARGRLGGIRVSTAQMGELEPPLDAPAGKHPHGRTCRITFPREALAMTYFAGPYEACDEFSVLVDARMTQGWRTDKGLKVGDSRSRIAKLYPKWAKSIARCGKPGLIRLAFVGARGADADRYRMALTAEVAAGRIVALRLCVPVNWAYAGL